MENDNYKVITMVLVIWAIFVSFTISVYFVSISKAVENINSLESRIARQDSLLQHHIKKAAFDSTNQANQKRVK